MVDPDEISVTELYRLVSVLSTPHAVFKEVLCNIYALKCLTASRLLLYGAFCRAVLLNYPTSLKKEGSNPEKYGFLFIYFF